MITQEQKDKKKKHIAKYKKEYYADNDLKPTEQLFFTITIIPLGAYESSDILPN